MKKIILILFIFFFLFSGVFAENLKVGTIERPPMSFKTSTGNWTGFSIDLLKEIAKEVGFKYNLKEFKIFPEMIKATEQGKVDFSIANISITSEREEKMDFSQPILETGLRVMTLADNKASIFDIILKSGILWFILGAIGLLLLIAHIVWFFERGTASDRHDYFRDDYLGGIWDAFWWAFIIMTMGGFENEVPASKFSRFLAMLWITISLFFISFLTAKITSSLTVAELNSGITSYKDLKNKKVAVIKSDKIIDFVETKIHAKPKIFLKYEDMYKALKNKEVVAIVGDNPILSYYAMNHDEFKVVGDIFQKENYGILFPTGSKLKEKIDRAIIKIREDGRYDDIYKKYFEEE